MNITDELFKLKDEKYKAFHSKLIPNINPDNIIGVRTPVLRKFSKEIIGTPEAEAFVLSPEKHRYYDEKNLHAMLIEPIADFDTSVDFCEAFLDSIDNWATCDMYSPKAFAKNRKKLEPKICEWIKSCKTYTVRFAINTVMRHFLGDDFNPDFMRMISEIRSDEYYINMMIAWYFATALAKQYNAAEKYISGRRLSPWVHNKAIQKAIESRRITDEQKSYLRTLKIKGR